MTRAAHLHAHGERRARRDDIQGPFSLIGAAPSRNGLGRARIHSTRNGPVRITVFLAWLLGSVVPSLAAAHHVLGRPAYSLNEDSNTPPSMQVETQIGDYFVTYMVFPAFPRPNTPGRINFYATRLDDGAPFQGLVTFKVRDKGWFGSREEILGVQPPDDNVYRQGFVFKDEGEYVVTAEFESGGQPYIVDFPLRIGEPVPVGPLGWAVGVILVVLLGVNLAQRRRLLTAKVRKAREEARS